MMSKRLALIIASYQYQDADLRQLVAPAHDAEALARVLDDPSIGGFEVQTLLNEPSHDASRIIEAFFADRKRDDLLLLYFSGHGIKDEDGRLYFATTNTRRTWLRSTAIPANFVNDVMRHSRSRRQVLLLDCCYSGAFARGMAAKADKSVDAREPFEQGHGLVVITASDAMQYAFEGDEIRGEGIRSVFTQALVDGLRSGKADRDGDGYVSLDELYDYIYDRVTDETPQQTPRKWAFDVRDRIIIAQRSGAVAKPFTPPAGALPPAPEPTLEPTLEPPGEGPLAGVRSLGERLLGRLPWKSKRARLTALLTGLALLAVAVGSLVLPSVIPPPVPDESLQVGVAEFAGCPQVSAELPKAIAPEPEQAAFTALAQVQNGAGARTHLEEGLDLVIWGRCDQPDQVTVNLETAPDYGRRDVLGIESVTARASARDLDRAARLVRAMISHLGGNHSETIASLDVLRQEASTTSEQAELAFLQANSLLLTGQYEAALTAYESAQEHGVIRARTYNNRGVAGMNLALKLREDGRPFDAALQTAVDDLSEATSSTDQAIAALAYANRGQARYLVLDQYEQALADCEQAVALAPAQPPGYVCRAAARLAPLVEGARCDLPTIAAVREDLATAHEQAPDLAEIYFWRGHLAFLQAAACDTSTQDRQKHEQAAREDAQEFLELINARPQLTSDEFMANLLAVD